MRSRACLRHRRRRRRHDRAGHCRQLAAERRALPTPAVSVPVPVFADTTVRTIADATAAPVGRDNGAARSPGSVRIRATDTRGSVRQGRIRPMAAYSGAIAVALQRIAAQCARDRQARTSPLEGLPKGPRYRLRTLRPARRARQAVDPERVSGPYPGRSTPHFGKHGKNTPSAPCIAYAWRAPCVPEGDRRSPGCDSPAAPGLATDPFRALPLKRRSG